MLGVAVADESSTASTAAITRRIGKTQKECSSVRSRVIDLQLAEPVARRKLLFALPYMSHAFENARKDVIPAPQDAWVPHKNPVSR